MMSREKHKWKSHKAYSIDALHRGGQARSSVEALVMSAEQRGLATQYEFTCQLLTRRNR